MADSQDYDIVILGAGSGGYAAALRAAELGMTVALVEGDKLGGTCLHRGCIPTKALLHSAEVAEMVRHAGAVGVNGSLDGIDMAGVASFRDGVVGRLYQGLQGLVAARQVNLVHGWGRLVAPDAVEVDGVRYRGKHVILASGSRSKTLPGLEIGGRVITSEQALELDHVPASAIVLGGGVIGVEFASLWQSFGTAVTILEALPNLVPNEDVSVSKALERAFRKRKIAFHTGTRFAGVEQGAEGVTVRTEDGGTYTSEILLVAVGRAPMTEGLGYDEQGVRLERGYVRTDERLRTSVPGVYAVGDIVPGLQLAHRGFQQGIFVAEEIAGLKPAPVVESGIPRVTYCDPNVASVGLTHTQAVEALGEENVVTLEYNLGGNGKSQILQTGGFVKLVREKDGPIVGVHMLGDRLGELVGEGQLIVNWEAYPEDVAALLHAHPTQDEALGEAALALAGKPLHAHN
ncbi:dihydrolipoyl dehydrogenase [Georgenia deserti]|uniref:Dihydrolipoyl dehydrogenase n=1 Tax=Georgenia deserti TaxID=2093781 RepID=A0ABW4L868_9MICO